MLEIKVLVPQASVKISDKINLSKKKSKPFKYFLKLMDTGTRERERLSLSAFLRTILTMFWFTMWKLGIICSYFTIFCALKVWKSEKIPKSLMPASCLFPILSPPQNAKDVTTKGGIFLNYLHWYSSSKYQIHVNYRYLDYDVKLTLHVLNFSEGT